MIDQASEVNNDVAKERYENTKGSTKKVASSKKVDLKNSRLEQKKVDDDKPKSSKEKTRDFKKQYEKKYDESKCAERQNKVNAEKPEYGTYSSGQLSPQIQKLNIEAKKKQLFKNSDDKDFGKE